MLTFTSMLTYKERNTFFQKLHPLSAVSIFLIYVIAFIAINNPIYILLILISLIILSVVDGCAVELLSYGKLILPFALLIMILNPLIVKNGDTVLIQGKFNFPVLGPIRITYEAVIYGLFSGLRVICITLIFGFCNMTIHPDRAFGYFAKYMKKSALLMSMTIRLFPSIMKACTNIMDVERLRKNNVFNKNAGLKKRVKGYTNIVNILFLSSLEDSGDMAEAMYSRGYGIGKRSTYFREKFTRTDISMLVLSVFICLYISYLKHFGLNEMRFYNKVDNPLNLISIHGIIICFMFFIPAAINWGWKIWKS